MAGYGNRTAPDSLPEDLTDQHTSTRLGLTDSHGAYSNAHPKYGSGATGGAGFGMFTSMPFTHPSTHPSAPYASAYSSLPSSQQFLPLSNTSSTHLVHPVSPHPRIRIANDLHDLGNKSDHSSVPTTTDEFRFDKHADTAPYSGASKHRAGSGSTGGAGYGNKTGEFGIGGTSCRHFPAMLT